MGEVGVVGGMNWGRVGLVYRGVGVGGVLSGWV